MSGGSFEYLCHKSAGELLGGAHEEQLARMADRLAELGYPDAAAETRALLLECRAAAVRLETSRTRLANVWMAVEWFDSCDWSAEQVASAVERYRKGGAR